MTTPTRSRGRWAVPMESPSRWADLTSEEISTWVERDPVAVLPVAAVEQHGPHLPLRTDVVIGEGVLEEAVERVSDDVPVLLLPTQSYGTSPEHESFPGTLSLDAATMEASIFDVGASAARAGVRRLVISNSHGGNRPVVDLVALRLRRAFEMLVVRTDYFRFPRPDDVELPAKEWAHGLHGGALETAMMLHLRPELVRSERVRDFPSLGEELEEELHRLGAEGAASFAWTAEDLGDAGVVGDATLADAAMGERLVAHYGRCLADVLQDARRFPVERLASGRTHPT